MAFSATKTPTKSDHPRSTPKEAKVSLQDFRLKGLLGRGAYAEVFVCERVGTGERLALKRVDKANLVKNNKQATVQMELKALATLRHPNVVRLYHTFQDEYYLYFVLELAANGTMQDELERLGSYELSTARFYAAELLTAISHLHSKGIIHRDLKPQNVLVTASRHLLLCDFGTAKFLNAPPCAPPRSSREGYDGAMEEKSFEGTAQYVSPEVLNNQTAREAADLWSLGVMLYQMLCGGVPFTAETDYLTFQKILQRDMEPFPRDLDDKARDLIDKLLVCDVDARCTAEQARAHPFFAGIDFASLAAQAGPAVSFAPEKKDGRRANNPEAGDSDEDAFAEAEGNGAKRSGSTTEEKAREAKRAEQKALRQKWQPFLLDNEEIVFTGLVKQGRYSLLQKKRQLILTDFPRFVAVDIGSMAITGEIQWSSNLSATVKGPTEFVVKSNQKEEFIDALNDKAADWVTAINRLKADQPPLL